MPLTCAQLAPALSGLYPPGTFTAEGFSWAVATVAARAFSLNVTERYGHTIVEPEDAGVNPIIVPFADLFNHHNSQPALQFSYEYDDTLRALSVYADQDYRAGDQLFISYGVLSNADLMLTCAAAALPATPA